MEGILVRSYFFCLLSVPYLDQEEIKLCKKFPYSYSIRLAFHMPGSYNLTIFIYLIGLWSRHLESYPLSVKDLGKKLITSNTVKRCLMSLWLKRRLVSAANMIGSNKRDTFGRSFTYTRIGSGLPIDPWGTPQLIYLQSVLLFLPIWTYCLLLDKCFVS